MLIEDLPVLRGKLRKAEGSLAAKWSGFLALAEHQAEAHPLYPAFAALVTEDTRWGEAFRARFDDKVTRLPVDALHGGCQFHTWCWSAPLARWAIAYDWVADQPAFSGFDHRRCADAFLDAIHSQVYPRVLARVPASDNQIASMLLACGVVGYLFGVKRGNDPRAVQLYRLAMGRIPEVAALAEAQFVGEGSTYMVGVNTAVMGLWYAYLRWLGKPLDRKTWLGCQESARNVISPGGLTLGWDAGGNARAFNMAGLALLARETNDLTPLALIDTLDMWHGIDHCAWFEDQRVWTLLWWPDAAPDWPLRSTPSEQVFPGWFHAHIGAALDDVPSRLRVAQLWDFCDGSRVGSVERPNTDPSALALYIDGSPLLLDGMPVGVASAFVYPPENILSPDEMANLERFVALRRQVTGQKLQTADLLNRFAHGCVGGSNALVLNREPWYYPRKQVHGQGTLWARLPRVQVAAADCRDHYRPRYPVQQVERTTFLLDRRFALVIDTLAATEPIAVGWQAFVRHEAVSVEKGRGTVRTPEGPALTIIPEDAKTLETTTVDNYPKPFGASVRVSWEKTVTKGTLATLLVPHDDERLGKNRDGWEGALAANWSPTGSTLPPTFERTVHGSFEDVTEALWAATAATWRLMRCRLTAPAGANYLRILVSNEQAGLWWNGQCVLAPNPGGAAKGTWGRCLPIALEAPLHGPAELVIATPCYHGSLQIGAGEWYRRAPLTEISLETGGESWTVRSVQGACTVSTGAEAARRGWDTDARWVIEFSDGGVALLAATRAVHARFPAFASEALAHAQFADGGWQAVNAALPAVEQPEPAQSLSADEAAPGVSLATIPETGAVCQALQSTNSGELLRLLDGPDWRVQRAAIERIGKLEMNAAAPRLRILLAQEVTLNLYDPPPTREPSGDWVADMRSPGLDLANRRFRVLQALLIALRQLGDRESLPIVRDLLRTSHHFYPVYKAAVELLAELGAAEDRPLLEYWAEYPETNASAVARAALASAGEPGRLT